jgi:hypothetical protein
MIGMTRTRVALTLSTLSLAGLLGLTGCGLSSHQVAAAAADLSDETYALQTVGVDAATDPSPAASAAPRAEHRRAIRKYLRKNTLHGEVTVQTKDGTRTIVVQRGTVSAVTATGVSVKSSDGYALTWTFAPKVRVVQNKKAVPATALKAGETVGVGGVKDGSTDTARLVIIQ